MVRLLRILLVIGMCIPCALEVKAQGYDQERIQLAKFIERMYNNAPFEGCRMINDYDKSYFISVVALDKAKYKTEQIMNRVAQVKSQRQAGEFLNGTQSFSEFIIKTPRCEEKGDSISKEEIIDVIKTNSTGYVKQLQLFTSFEDKNNFQVFVFLKQNK